jgi:Amt family ammonium transporter
VGTLSVGLFALDGGVFTGGGFKLLGIQALGALATGVWALGLGFLLFYTIKKTIGVRVEKRIEEEGLDVYEHGESAYN